MEADQLAMLMNELKNGGPSPFAADAETPLPMLFKNEIETLAGKGVTNVFGEEALASVIVTGFRTILYQERKRGPDLCKSFWHKVDFDSWRWEEPDGFVVASFETDPPEYMVDALSEEHGLPAVWKTYVVNPDGERKQIAELLVHLTYYHYHQESRFVLWNKEIAIPLKSGNTMRHSASYFFTMKMNINYTITGTTNLDALQLLMDDPFEAAQLPGGEIPEDAPMHPNKATRAVQRVGVSRVSSGRAGRNKRADQARKAVKKAVKVGSQVKSGVDLAKKAAGIVASGSAAGVKAAASQTKKAAVSSKRERPKKPSRAVKGKPAEKKATGPASKGRSSATAQAAQAAGLRVCVACGAKLKATTLFCGECGEKVVERIIDEVKDQVSGKVQNVVVEKINEIPDDDRPKPAKAKKAMPTASQKSRARKSTPSKTPQKISKPKKDQPAQKKAGKSKAKPSTKSRTKCPSCGRKIQPAWSFCPDCSATLPIGCPECNAAVEQDWKFCPHCTATLPKA